MQALDIHRKTSNFPLGQRRGALDLARFALDLTWARAESERAARAKDYPSPPMSGSPPLPTTTTQEAGDRSRGSYQTTSQDVYRGVSTTQGDSRMQPPIQVPARSFPLEAPERMVYSFPRPEEASGRPLPYPGPVGQMLPQHSYLPLPGPGAGPPAYAASPRPSAAPVPNPETPQYTSPKTQRKTKGHVASACVPCKRAHLRCDAQRPCSRCQANGKEDACVDVQHKKRGRPRLREERDLRYDTPGRLGQPPDANIRRPLSLFAQPAAVGQRYDDSIRRTQSYRVLKSQPADPIAPRFAERASIADANLFPSPLSISTRTPEPAAFLTMDFEIAKVSNTFTDAIGRQHVQGLKLVDVLIPGDREKTFGHQRQLQDEQSRKDPHYLPPIFGKEEAERVIQGLGFTPEEIGRYPLDRQDFLTFSGQDGQIRSFPLRLGLAKQDSIYFVVVLLNITIRPIGGPTPSPHSRDPRDIQYAYQPLQTQQAYSQPTPVSATFDAGRPRMGSDSSGFGPRRGSAISGLSPGMPSTYAASPSRPDYPAGPSTYSVPRSELMPGSRPPRQPEYQLPPIRSQQQGAPPPTDPTWQRDDKSRVDIGGLIDRHDSSKRPQ